ncbi:hypothetical protein K1719_045372 [Acacia pycnantha]|nr:hypothetical protein K1719_045372 [Acacia pycnantha]
MASAAESIEKGADREIANLNERIRAMEQDMSAMKEFIKEAIVQGNWPGGNSSHPVTADDLGSSGVGAEEKTIYDHHVQIRALPIQIALSQALIESSPISMCASCAHLF